MKILVQVQNLLTGATVKIATPKIDAYDKAIKIACEYWDVDWRDVIILD